MSDFDHPTHRLVQLIAEHLAGMGQTNVRGTPVRYGWTLDVCGNDNPRFSAGVDFSYVPRDPAEERLVPVASWSDLDRLIAAC